ncbi:hypothetical protein VTN96DRAFT_1567 [Rasamsonia emersonii]
MRHLCRTDLDPALQTNANSSPQLSFLSTDFRAGFNRLTCSSAALARDPPVVNATMFAHRTLHFSNGIRLGPLWQAHLLFDLLFVLILSSVAVSIFIYFGTSVDDSAAARASHIIANDHIQDPCDTQGGNWISSIIRWCRRGWKNVFLNILGRNRDPA